MLCRSSRRGSGRRRPGTTGDTLVPWTSDSAYAHGFARVAACTMPVAIADPAHQRRAGARAGAACHDDGVAVAVFPELCLTGYAIDDLLLQDALLDAVQAAIDDAWSRRSRDLRPVLVVGAPLRHGNRLLNCAVVIHRGRDPRRRRRSPTCRPTASSTSAGASPRATTGAAAPAEVAGQRGAVRPRPALPGDRRAGPARCTSRSARTCGCRCRRAPRRRWPARPCSPTSPAARSPSPGPRTAGCWSARASARCHAAYVYAAAGQGESSDRPVLGRPDDGLRVRRAARRDRAVPRRAAPHGRRRRPRPDPAGAAAAGHLRRQPARGRTSTRPTSTSSSSPSTRPTGDIGLRRKVDRFPFVPDDAERLALDCYEAYNIQVSGLEQRLARDRPAEGRDRRLRRPRLDPRADRRGQGDGPARPPAQRHPRVHDAGLRDRRRAPRPTPPGWPRRSGVSFEELDIRPAARQMLADLGHPFADGEPVYDVTFENVQAGLRTDYLFRLANHAAASCSAPATCPSSRSAGAPTASATRCRTTPSTPACRRR